MMDTDSGCAYIYEYGGEPGYWILMYTIIDEFRWGQTGFSVSMNSEGNLAAVGSPQSFNNNPDSEIGGEPGYGSVRIFAYNNESWSQIGVIRGQNQFGRNVSITGIPDAYIIGATSRDRLTAYRNINGTEDYETLYDKWLNGNWDGASVSISRAGDHIVYGYTVSTHDVLIYNIGTNLTYTITNIASDDITSNLDVRISQQGNRIIVGAPFSHANKGMVYVYENIEKPIGNIPELNGTEPISNTAAANWKKVSSSVMSSTNTLNFQKVVNLAMKQHNIGTQETEPLTDYQRQILELQSQELKTSGLMIWSNRVVTLNILEGTLKTLEVCLGGIDLGAGVGELQEINTMSDDSIPYYTLSDYTLEGCVLSIYNVPSGEVSIRLNNDICLGAYYRDDTVGLNA
jgi:hypothetical protein